MKELKEDPSEERAEHCDQIKLPQLTLTTTLITCVCIIERVCESERKKKERK